MLKYSNTILPVVKKKKKNKGSNFEVMMKDNTALKKKSPVNFYSQAGTTKFEAVLSNQIRAYERK